MKKSFYYILMMLLFVMVSFFLYLAILTVLARYHIISLRDIDWVLGLAMSCRAYLAVAIVGMIIGYFFARRWWQIIYIDGVYYFDKSKMPPKRRVTRKKTL